MGFRIAFPVRSAQPLRRFGLLVFLCTASVVCGADRKTWTTLATEGSCAIHEEGSMAVVGDRIYLIGGRREPPVNGFDPVAMEWTDGASAPFQMHHFQAVVLGDKIAVIGGFTGGYPRETPLEHIWFYVPATDRWEQGPEIPEARRRGACGVVVDGDWVYLVAGIVNGHWDGHVPWLDRWNWTTGEWEILPDAPRARDHFQAAILEGRIVVAGGRRSSAATKQTFHLTVPEVDVYDLNTREWQTLEGKLPTERAGCMALSHNDHVIIVGGESMAQRAAHDEVEYFSFATGKWRTGTPLAQGRHGTGICRIGDTVYVAGGNGDRGGGNKLQDIECIDWASIFPAAK